ncbi:hypothetical protein CXG81DRAFT_20872 [Caulochytrium protostelioides]|uniref:ATP-dependent RNA helicase n=1 Tax=Caulochytrium protostelioides TaxID=1555241 RepID=A0A4V1IU16_9FUNG|nr:hypothetical protein CXG81DRAFT_20872 [Caulochytrium protostelioides]|eukprot:RKO98987.1 hypothetical protein CXG81DRAFT_20872 [Caulochytrium protostelioides]
MPFIRMLPSWSRGSSPQLLLRRRTPCYRRLTSSRPARALPERAPTRSLLDINLITRTAPTPPGSPTPPLHWSRRLSSSSPQGLSPAPPSQRALTWGRLGVHSQLAHGIDLLLRQQHQHHRADVAAGLPPTRAQAALIPPFIGGRNIWFRGATGSGKTWALVVALCEALHRDAMAAKPSTGPFVYVAATRELAIQVASWVAALRQATRAASASASASTTAPASTALASRERTPPNEAAAILLAIGTIPMAEQTAAWKQMVAPYLVDRAAPSSPPPPTLLIGTPGRFLELIRAHPASARVVPRLIVLDEADELLLPLSRYAPAGKKFQRLRHPPPTETLLQTWMPLVPVPAPASPPPAEAAAAASASASEPSQDSLENDPAADAEEEIAAPAPQRRVNAGGARLRLPQLVLASATLNFPLKKLVYEGGYLAQSTTLELDFQDASPLIQHPLATAATAAPTPTGIAHFAAIMRTSDSGTSSASPSGTATAMPPVDLIPLKTALAQRPAYDPASARLPKQGKHAQRLRGEVLLDSLAPPVAAPPGLARPVWSPPKPLSTAQKVDMARVIAPALAAALTRLGILRVANDSETPRGLVGPGLVFIDPSASADAVVAALQQTGLPAVTLEAYRAARFAPTCPTEAPALVVAAASTARGMDLPALQFAVMLVPLNATGYVHCAGRVGRVGQARPPVLPAVPAGQTPVIWLLGQTHAGRMAQTFNHLAIEPHAIPSSSSMPTGVANAS